MAKLSGKNPDRWRWLRNSRASWNESTRTQ